MAEQDLDRSEAATPHKLQKAREKGQTARSMETAAAGSFAVAMVYLAWQGLGAFRALADIARSLLVQAGQAPAQPLWPLLASTVTEGISLMLPLMGAVVAAAVRKRCRPAARKA